MKKQSILIVGGGPAGLSAAHELVSCKNADVVVCEKSTMVGGISRTESHNGYRVDIGGHRFFTKNQEIQKIWTDVLGKEFIKVSRVSRIYYKHKFYNYPIRIINTLRNLGVIESVRIVISYLASYLIPIREERTFEQWVSNRFGKRLYETFFKTYTEKVWGIPCSSIQADWASQRIQGLSLKTAVVNAIMGKSTSKSLIEEFDYPRLGPGMMWDGLKEIIEQRGGRVLVSCDVQRIRHNNNQINQVVCVSDGAPMTRKVDSLISSMPISRLIGILEPAPPDHVLRAAEKLSYRSFLIVILIIDEEALFPDQWIYIHNPEVHVGRIQNFKNWSSNMIPKKEATSLGLEYFCNEGDEFWNLDDQSLIELASRELDVLNLSSGGSVIEGYVIRQEKAYPVYDELYKENVQVLRDYLDKFSNLQTVGRNGMHRYNNMDHSMMTGIMAAQNLNGAHHNVWSVNGDETYLEEGMREFIENSLQRSFARLHKRAFATAVGTSTGLALWGATLLLVVTGGEVGGPTLSLLNQFFWGYSVTGLGAVLGLIYGFIVGFTGGWFFGLLRNGLTAIQFNLLRTKADRIHIRNLLDYL